MATRISSSQQRQEVICALVNRGENPSVRELAGRFEVSEMTIHRDLNALQEEGLIKRVHGAVLPSERMIFEFDFAGRRRERTAAKQAIARKACELIRAKDRIILDTGTTTLELAYLLREFGELTVVTPSIAVASVLQFSPGVEIVLLGGVMLKSSPDLTGVVTEKVLEMFMVDKVFQGIDGIGLNGDLYNADMRVARVDQKMRRQSQQAYILADSSKIGKTHLAYNGSLNEVDGLIIDDGIRPDHLEAMRKLDTEILPASTRGAHPCN